MAQLPTRLRQNGIVRVAEAMIKSFFVCLILFVASSSSRAESLLVVDLDTAKARAAEAEKDILILFTGSDWCDGCKRLKREVLDTDIFQSRAPKFFVFVEADSRHEPPLPEGLQKHIDALKEQYSVSRLPTFITLDTKGRGFARLGYQGEDPESFMTRLGELRAYRVTRDRYFARAATVEGEEKVHALGSALKLMVSQGMLSSYLPEAEQLIAADPADKTKLASEYRARLQALSIRKLVQEGHSDGAVKTAKEVAATALDPELKQEVLTEAARALLDAGQYEKGMLVAEQAIEPMPDSKGARELRKVLLHRRVNEDVSVGKDLERALARIDEFLAAPGGSTELAQDALFLKANVLKLKEDFPAALAVLEKAAALAPNSPLAQSISNSIEALRKRIEGTKKPD